MGYIRTEEEVDQMIDEMIRKNKGKYITQGVSFNKDSPRQIELLKMVLLRANSFSGFVKELLAQIEIENRIGYQPTKQIYPFTTHYTQTTLPPVEKPIDTGNFL